MELLLKNALTPYGQRVWNYVRRDRVHPALILGGPDREAKFSLAKNIAKHFLCTKKTGANATYCNQCSACRRVEKDIHPDLLIVREEQEDTIKIETVRQVCQQMALSFMEGPAKVCIIDECHRLNASSANAFLKTLEEPGPDRYFLLLTTQPGALLATILSRCLVFHLQPNREGIEAPVSEAPEVAKAFEDFVSSRNVSSLLALLNEKEKALAFLQYLQRKLRTSLLAVETEGEVYPPFQLNSAEELIEKYDETLRIEGRLRSNANYGLMLESLLLQHY